MKILIVDDEPMVREGLKIGIDWSEMGFEEVECASDGKSALQVLGNLNRIYYSQTYECLL